MNRSRAKAVAGSVALHVIVFSAGAFSFRASQPAAMPHTLAIEATVVDLSALDAQAEARKVAEAARQRALAEEAARQQREQEAADRAERERVAAEEAARQQAEAERLAKERNEAEERERIRKEQAQAEQAAREKAEQERQAELRRQKEAEEKRLAEEARLRREAEDRRQREEEARRKAEAEALLLAQLEEEERRLEANRAGLRDQYALLIRQKIQRSWLRPDSAGQGLECEVSVTQLPSREVVQVSVGRCNGDAATIRSIEAAVYKASPLPAPPDPALFERKLTVIFKPDE